MKKLQFALVFFSFCFANIVGAQTASVCEAALAAINDDLRLIAQDQYLHAEDNSAPRATLREMRKTVATQKAQINLALMRDAKCVMPSTPYDEMAFYKLVGKCEVLRPELGKPYTVEERRKIDADFKECQTQALSSPIKLFK